MSGHKIKLDGYVWDEKKGLRRDPKDLVCGVASAATQRRHTWKTQQHKTTL